MVQSSEYYQEPQSYDDRYQSRYEDAYNVKIANAFVNCEMTSSYDHQYAQPHTEMTSYWYAHPHYANYATSDEYNSATEATSYDPMTDNDPQYYQTVIKDEPMYDACDMYNGVMMTSQTDDDVNVPSVVSHIKPDLKTKADPIMLPPLSPEDVSENLNHNITMYEQESEMPDTLCDFVAQYGVESLTAYNQRQLNQSYHQTPPPAYPTHMYDESYESCDSCGSGDDGYVTATPPSSPPAGRSPNYYGRSPNYVNPELKPSNNGLFVRNERYTSESSSGSSDDDEVPNPKQRKANRGHAKNGKLLWQFMVDLMVNPRCRHLADWVDRESGVFRLLQSAAVAEMWGKEKGNEEMNYEKMSRALRFLRICGYFVFPPKPNRRRLYFKFGPKAQEYLAQRTRHFSNVK